MKTLLVTLIIVSCMSLSACSPAMTNDQIIAETQKCANVRMTTRELQNVNGEITDVVCTADVRK